MVFNSGVAMLWMVLLQRMGELVELDQPVGRMRITDVTAELLVYIFHAPDNSSRLRLAGTNHYALNSLTTAVKQTDIETAQDSFLILTKILKCETQHLEPSKRSMTIVQLQAKFVQKKGDFYALTQNPFISRTLVNYLMRFKGESSALLGVLCDMFMIFISFQNNEEDDNLLTRLAFDAKAKNAQHKLCVGTNPYNNINREFIERLAFEAESIVAIRVLAISVKLDNKHDCNLLKRVIIEADSDFSSDHFLSIVNPENAAHRALVISIFKDCSLELKNHFIRYFLSVPKYVQNTLLPFELLGESIQTLARQKIVDHLKADA